MVQAQSGLPQKPLRGKQVPQEAQDVRPFIVRWKERGRKRFGNFFEGEIV